MRKVLSIALAVAFVTVAVTACGDDDATGTNGTGLDVAGTWSITEVVDASDCGSGTYTDTYTATVTQSGNNVTVTIMGLSHSGTLSGRTLTWSGSFPEDGGTTTTNVTITFSSDGNSLTGSSTWSWTDGVESCSGTSAITGTKQ